MGYIHIYMPHRDLCYKIEFGVRTRGDDTPKHKVGRHITLAKLDMKYLPANLIRMLIAREVNIPHYEVMLFGPSGHYVNTIEKVSHVGTDYLNFTYADLRHHLHYGEETSANTFHMADDEIGEVSFFNLFQSDERTPKEIIFKDDDGIDEDIDAEHSYDTDLLDGGGPMQKGKRIHLGKAVEAEYGRKIVNAGVDKADEDGRICICEGKLKFESTRVVPQVHSRYFTSGNLLYALPLTKKDISMLPLCNTSHMYINLENFKTFINEVNFQGRNKEAVMKCHLETMKTFLPNYIEHIATKSPFESDVVHYFNNVVIDWAYTTSSPSMFAPLMFTSAMCDIEGINNILTWSRVKSQSSPQITLRRPYRPRTVHPDITSALFTYHMGHGQ